MTDDATLQDAIRQRSLETVQRLIAEGQDPNQSNNPFSLLPLHYSCAVGDLKITEYLITNGANVNLHDDLTLTPLHHACSSGFPEIARVLITHGADIDAYDDMAWTPLHHACREEHLEVVRCLIENGADVNAHLEDRIGETPLGDVAASCSLELAKILVDAGADPTIAGWMKITALDRAKGRKDSEGKGVYELLKETQQNHSKMQKDEKK